MDESVSFRSDTTLSSASETSIDNNSVAATSSFAQIDPTSSFTDYGLAISAIILFIVGVSGNVTAIVTYTASPRLRCPQNLFVINLAVADCVTLFCAPIVITNSLTDALVKPEFACYGVVIFLRLTTVMGMVTISAIGFIRYISIVHPTSKIAVFTWPRCFAGLAAIWLYASIWTSFPFIPGFSTVLYNPRMHICLAEHQPISTFGTFVFVYTASVVLLGYSYVRIFYTVRQSGRRVGQQQQQQQQTAIGNNSATTAEQRQANRKRARRMVHEGKLARQLIIIFGVFVLCWAPFISYTMFERNFANNLPSYVYNFYIVAILINAAVNPLIYLCYNSTYRIELRRLFCCWCLCRVCVSTASDETVMPDKTMQAPNEGCSIDFSG